ncbi:hypothetical protein BDZ91DRAFT_731485 [Kalaharituber pfeilii]|nr:hypothetical protein BDZ91DRAFT_731485 [Kalaharituber pfeilii]
MSNENDDGSRDFSQVDWVRNICFNQNFMMAVQDNVLYTMGGWSMLNDGSALFSESYLRMIDLSKSLDIKEADSATTIKHLPDDIPRSKFANLFVADGKLYLFGGSTEYMRVYNENGTVSTAQRASLRDKLWTYDIAENKWTTGSSGLGDETIGRAAIAWDPKEKIGWIYGGSVESTRHFQGNNDTGEDKQLSQPKTLMKYDLSKSDSKPEKVKTGNPVGASELSELVYLENMGEKGIFILIGGSGEKGSLRSLRNVDIYDIATETWYSQGTTAETGLFPRDRQGMCSVVASAPDGSSHNIYIYGGIAEDKPEEQPMDDVYVLSLPAFHWMYVSDGLETTERSFHKCTRLHEKYMVSIRGKRGANSGCDSNFGVQLFDLAELQWTTKLDVDSNPTYTVPETVFKVIGGNATGGATFREPRNNWIDDRLRVIFGVGEEPSTTQNSTTLTPSATSPPVSPNTNDASSQESKSSAGPIAGGVVGGVLGVIAIVAIIWLVLRRRKRQPSDESSPAELMHNYPYNRSAHEVSATYTQRHEMTGSYDHPDSHELAAYGPNAGLMELPAAAPAYKEPPQYGSYYAPSKGTAPEGDQMIQTYTDIESPQQDQPRSEYGSYYPSPVSNTPAPSETVSTVPGYSSGEYGHGQPYSQSPHDQH